MRTSNKRASSPASGFRSVKEPLAEGVTPLKRNSQRDWQSLNDEELVEFAKEFIARDGIEGRKELQKADPGLYQALRKRKLLDQARLERKKRDWAAMDDEELVGFANRFIAEMGIVGRKELAKANQGLYNSLRKRKLLNAAIVAYVRREQRDWAAMGDEELVGFAKVFVTGNEIGWRAGLAKADRGLYQALRRRKLLDRAFSDIESSKHAEVVQGVLDALESFGDSDA